MSVLPPKADIGRLKLPIAMSIVCYGAAMCDQFAGHSDQSAGAGYEHGQPIEAMKAAIEKLTLDGFALA